MAHFCKAKIVYEITKLSNIQTTINSHHAHNKNKFNKIRVDENLNPEIPELSARMHYMN